MTKLSFKHFAYYGIVLMICLALGFGFHRSSSQNMGCVAMFGACGELDNPRLVGATTTKWGLPFTYKTVEDKEYERPNGIGLYETATEYQPAAIAVDLAFWLAVSGAVQGEVLWLTKWRTGKKS